MPRTPGSKNKPKSVKELEIMLEEARKRESHPVAPETPAEPISEVSTFELNTPNIPEPNENEEAPYMCGACYEPFNEKHRTCPRCGATGLTYPSDEANATN